MTAAGHDRPLPPGWRWVRLGEVCPQRPILWDPRRAPDEEFTYIDIASVDNVRKAVCEPQRLLGIDAPSRARQVVREGDVIVATTRPYLNAVAVIPASLDSQVCSTGFCVLRPDSEVLDGGFLFAWVRHEEFIRALSDLVRGALYPAVTDDQVRHQLIPLPPLAEQRRIAAILSEQLAAVDRARAAIEAMLEAAQELKVAYLQESLSMSTPRATPLTECLVEVKDGIGPRWNELPVLGATRDGLASAKEPVGKSPERYKQVVAGTIFYNPMRILIGSIALVDDGEPTGITSPDYVVFRTRPGILHHRWFYNWLRSPFGEQFIRSLARGAVRERILFRRLVTGTVKLPDWSSQCAVAEQLLNVDRLVRSIQNEITEISRLPSALLRQAFRGEI